MISLVHATTRVDPTPARDDVVGAGTAAIRPAAVLALVLSAPFEVPLARLGSAFVITSVEAAILCAVVGGLAAIVHARRRIVWATPITPAAVACVAVACVAALFSPVDRANGLRFAGRMAAAYAVFLLVVNAVTSRRIARTIVRALLATGAVVATIAVLEVAQVRAVLSALTLFRPGFHVVGGQLRATSTLFYPTITSMYLEVIFALGLWLLLDRATERSRRDGVVVFAALAAVGAGIVATFTRAGLIASAASLATAAAMHYVKVRRLDGTHASLARLALVLVGLVVVSRSPDVLLTRLRTEGSQDWYGARYDVPHSLEFVTGAEYRVPITLENTGRVVWDSSSVPMFAMSYHWLRADTEAVVQFEGRRTAFPTPIAPGQRTTLAVNVAAPGQPGEYVLVWDVVHENRAWLSTEGVTAARSTAHVDGPRVSVAATPMDRLPASNLRTDRLTLWRTALRVAAAHPLLGIGPDNFREVYGDYAGEPAWDTRVHANNMYLEVLAGGGVAGLATLMWLLAASALALLRRWWNEPPAAAAATTALCAVWLVVSGHALVDSFLTFTTTYLMFAVAAGLAFSPGFDHADRV